MRFGQRPMGVLKSLTLSQLDDLKAVGAVRNYRKNESIYELGQPTDALHLVMRGRRRRTQRRIPSEVLANVSCSAFASPGSITAAWIRAL